MPYSKLSDLPKGVRSSLPHHGQEIYRAAFNNAYDEHDDKATDEREQTAHRIAWSAVKNVYEKDSRGWHKKEDA